MSKQLILTNEELDHRITCAVRSLSRKKFTEKQLKSLIVNGKVPGESRRTKTGYQLFLDDFRIDMDNEQRSQVGKVSKEGATAWKNLDEKNKAVYLEKAAELRKEIFGEEEEKPKRPRGRPPKNH